MSDPMDDSVPEELQSVVSRLRAERVELDPLRMDQLRNGVLTRARRNRQRGSFMKSRIAAALTTVALVGGSGGALAVAGTSGAGSHGSAAHGEYRPGKGCGDRNHHHQGHEHGKGCPGLGHGHGHDDDG
ncbi:MAG: hypothetical protein ACJ780_01240 [Solirubrobacteraceae bacterium]